MKWVVIILCTFDTNTITCKDNTKTGMTNDVNFTVNVSIKSRVF